MPMTVKKRRFGAGAVLLTVIAVLTLPNDVVTAGDNVWGALNNDAFARVLIFLVAIALIVLILGPRDLWHAAKGLVTPDSSPDSKAPEPAVDVDTVDDEAPMPLGEAHRRTPHLVFREPTTPEATVKQPPQYPGSVGKFLVIQIANDPPDGVPTDAGEHVHAYVTITDADGEVRFSDVPARWQDKPQPAQLSPYQPIGAPELTETTLHPNGASHGIDTVVYLRHEREFHLWTPSGPRRPDQSR
jgi:hypothetical protein